MLNKIIYTLILSGLITSCSLVAPNRPDPTVTLPTSWNFTSNAAESNLPYVAWWHKFNDVNLDRLIDRALTNNSNLEQAKANIDVAKAQLMSVEMSWIPSITALAGVFNMQPLLPQPQLMYGMYAGYSSLNVFNIIAQSKAAKLGVEAAQMQLEGAKLDVIAQTASAYYTLISQQEELKLNQEYIADLDQNMQIQKQRKLGGLDTTDSTINAAQTYYQALSQLKAIENNILKSQNALNYLLGDMPGTNYPTTDFAKINTTYANVSSVPATIIGNRPDIAVTALQYKMYAQDITATYTQLLPQFMLGAGPAGGTSGGVAGSPANYNTTIQMNFITWSLNPSIFADASNYEGQKKSAYVSYIDTVQKALRDINNDLATNKITNERYQLLKLVAQDAQKKYTDAYQNYKSGLKAYSDTFSSKENLSQAKISLNQMKLSQLQAIISLYQDLGGGYRYGESTIKPTN